MKVVTNLVATLALWVPITSSVAQEPPSRRAAGTRRGRGTGGDGSPADQARLVGPFGVAFDAAGTLYFVEMPGNRVRQIDADGSIATIARAPAARGASATDGPAAKAELNGPHSLAVTRDGDVFIADTWNNRVRKIDARTGQIATVAGTGRKGFSGDGGPARPRRTSAGSTAWRSTTPGRRSTWPTSTTAGSVASTSRPGPSRPWRATAGGASPTTATTPVRRRWSIPGPWPSTAGATSTSWSAAAMPCGWWTAGQDPDGRRHREAGRVGRRRPRPRTARSTAPSTCASTTEGNVIIADTENHRIRVYSPADGKIRTIAGTGRKGAKGLGGPADQAELSQPHGVTIGPGGILYIADSSNSRIVKIMP